ncbi:MAG: TetR/AcrR family transcriptional regulator [Pseudomonadota bacterium]
MEDVRDDARRRVIEDAAYAVLLEKGYRRTSMLAVAKRANASNQTLYRWYGSKQGLFTALIEANADEALAVLRTSEASDVDATMEAFGAALLGVVTGEKAVALNRAAAADADETGELGHALAKAGRARVLPAITARLTAARLEGLEPDEAAELYVSLLVGDLQIRRVIGVLGPLPDEERARRSRTAWARVKAGPAS